MARPSEGVRPRRRPPHRVPSVLLDLAAGREPSGAAIDRDVVSWAIEHRVSGLLWSWAREHLHDEQLKTRLAMNDLYVQAHLARVWAVLELSVARLAEAGIEVATLKGVTAEARWYDRRGERPCSDVDLLLSPDDVHRVADVVRILQPDHPWVSYVSPLASSGRIQSVTMKVSGLEVDLHLDLLKLGVPMHHQAAVWRHTRPYSLPGGGTVRVLDETTALLHLLVHLNKDRFQRLLGYADIPRIMATGVVDWERLHETASSEGIEWATHSTLQVVVNQLRIPWPGPLPRPRGSRTRLWSLIWRPSIRLRGIEGRLRFRRRQDWITLLARSRRREALRWWLRDLWPPAPIVDAHYGEITGPYLWKVFRGRVAASRQLRARLEAGQAEANGTARGPRRTTR